MALEDIFRALEEQAEAETKTILDSAKAQAKAITKEADEEADTIKRRKLEQVDAALNLKTAQIVNAARLDNKKKVAALKDEATNDVFGDALKAMGSVRGSSDYATMFRALLEEAMASMGDDVEVVVDPRDEKLAKKVLSDLGANHAVKTDVTTAGGVLVRASAGRVVRRNTFEDRMEKLRRIAQSQIAEILFV